MLLFLLRLDCLSAATWLTLGWRSLVPRWAEQAVDQLEIALREGAEREDELLQLLVENLAPMYDEGASGMHSTMRSTSPTRGGVSCTTTPRSSLAAATVRRPSTRG